METDRGASMNASAYTPGPWRTAYPEWSVIKAAANMHVATVKWLSVGMQGKARRERLGAESVANARLIATAPELLQALKLYLSTYADTQTHPTVTQEAECINVVRAAVAKAEGREARP